MKKVKISLAVMAFVIAAGTAFTSKAISAGWYVPDYAPGQSGRPSAPANCTGGTVLCATHYNASGIADQQVFKN